MGKIIGSDRNATIAFEHQLKDMAVNRKKYFTDEQIRNGDDKKLLELFVPKPEREGKTKAEYKQEKISAVRFADATPPRLCLCLTMRVSPVRSLN